MYDDYDPGILNDFGGGDVAWWMDYIRTEIDRCNEYWRDQISSSSECSVHARVIPQANERQKKDGWTFDYNLLYDISEFTKNAGYSVGMEEVETVLIALKQKGLVV